MGEPKIRFSAGAPLILDGRHRLGTLCVIDREPRTVKAKDLELLQHLALFVTQMMVIEHALQDERRLREQAVARVSDRNLFIADLSHELHTSLNHVFGFTDLMHGQALGPVGHPQ